MTHSEADAWAAIAATLETREYSLTLGGKVVPHYAPSQPNLCLCVGQMRQASLITPKTFCRMLHRLRLFTPREDTSRKALYWDRHFLASRLARINAAWFLHAMAKRREPLE